MEEYCRIKVNIERVFLFLLNSKTKYTSQTPTVNHIIYKTHKYTMSNLNIKIVIAIITQYKMKEHAGMILRYPLEIHSL